MKFSPVAPRMENNNKLFLPIKVSLCSVTMKTNLRWPWRKTKASRGKLWKVLVDFDPATTRKPHINLSFFRSGARAQPISKEISSVMRSLTINIFRTIILIICLVEVKTFHSWHFIKILASYSVLSIWYLNFYQFLTSHFWIRTRQPSLWQCKCSIFL